MENPSSVKNPLMKFLEKKIAFFIILLIILHFCFGISTIKRTSLTFDEPTYITSGYYYLKNWKFDFNCVHPPVGKMILSLPLFLYKLHLPEMDDIFRGPVEATYADIFIYRNKIDAERISNNSRIMVLSLSCILAFLIFYWTESIYGIYPAIVAFLFYIFNTNIIAHSTLATTDFPLTFFVFLSFYFFWLLIKKSKNLFFTVIISVCVFLSVMSKFSGLILVPVFLILFFIFKNDIEKSGINIYVHIIVFLLVFSLSILFFYGPSKIKYFFEGLSGTMKGAYSGAPVFLCGKHSDTGFPQYYLIAFLVKTQIPLLLFLFLWIVFERKGIFKKENILFVIPVIFYFFVFSFSNKQLGIRYILPIYPLIIISCSSVVNKIKVSLKSSLLSAVFIAVMFFWYSYSFVRVHPWHLSYFNEFTGGSENGYKYLSDSDIDWGQGLKELSLWYRSNNVNGIYLSYFGSADPHYYGIKYIPVMMVTGVMDKFLRKGDEIVFEENKDIYFAISVTNLNSTYYRNKEVFKYFLKCKPYKIVAYSIFIYKLNSDLKLYEKFKNSFRK